MTALTAASSHRKHHSCKAGPTPYLRILEMPLEQAKCLTLTSWLPPMVLCEHFSSGWSCKVVGRAIFPRIGWRCSCWHTKRCQNKINYGTTGTEDLVVPRAWWRHGEHQKMHLCQPFRTRQGFYARPPPIPMSRTDNGQIMHTSTRGSWLKKKKTQTSRNQTYCAVPYGPSLHLFIAFIHPFIVADLTSFKSILFFLIMWIRLPLSTTQLIMYKCIYYTN